MDLRYNLSLVPFRGTRLRYLEKKKNQKHDLDFRINHCTRQKKIWSDFNSVKIIVTRFIRCLFYLLPPVLISPLNLCSHNRKTSRLGAIVFSLICPLRNYHRWWKYCAPASHLTGERSSATGRQCMSFNYTSVEYCRKHRSPGYTGSFLLN